MTAYFFFFCIATLTSESVLLTIKRLSDPHSLTFKTSGADESVVGKAEIFRQPAPPVSTCHSPPPTVTPEVLSQETSSDALIQSPSSSEAATAGCDTVFSVPKSTKQQKYMAVAISLILLVVATALFGRG
eukprot:TRINITY_DN66449_c0_g1_i1.p1 TRINITY_DN66449_c0_g1~~TRINITY_DN66449_c0_g1_i1.p1  ORF type:complete len:130 (+),score=4.39 TRINITY_DN66449_c0_g1_i1:481-870(+)